ncbi:MAG TPA: VWA domain-containing protein, partial [Armatimonadaceae bacterium]|nr:VWA domain-containing protein [Armatimonadaceae bacterium]
MNLIAPLSLLFLPLAGGAIVLLYLLRLKRRDRVVSSVMLWQAALQDTQANAPFQKLKRNLLLLLQLLACLFLAFALARPFLWASGLGGKTTALVLDASASMNATDERPTRFDAAVREAETLIRRKEARDAVALVLAADKPVLLAPLTSETDKLLSALARARATDTSGDMREAITFAASQVASRAGAQVTVLSDGAYGRLEEMSLGGAAVGQITFGKRGENVGITAFDVRDALSTGEGREAFVTLQNFGRTRRAIPLEIRLGDDLVAAHEVVLAPGENKSEVFERLRLPEGGVVTARADVKDDLKADDAAQIVLAPRRKIKALLVSEGNAFLERALSLEEYVTVDRVAPSSYKTTDSADHEVTVFDDAAPPADLPPGRYLFWGGKPASKESPVTPAGQEAAGPTILDWSRSHPLMRFVDLANVRLQRAQGVAPTAWGQTLAETDAGPLIVAGERGGTRAVYVAFTTYESDMALRPAFPIFLTNSLLWLTARPGDAGGVTRPGEVVTLAATAGAAGALTVTRPDGGRDTLPAPTPGTAALYD